MWGCFWIYSQRLWHAYRLDPPTVSIGNLSSQIASSNLSQGDKQSLTVSLENALKSMEKGNARAAANQLNAFIHKVEDLLNNGLIDAATGQAWLDAARMLIAVIG